MRFLPLILFISCACNPTINVKHKGIEIPKKFVVDTNVGPDFKSIKEYCDGKVLHDIEKKQREEDPNYSPDADDIKFMQDDCYYGFNFSFNDPDFQDWLASQNDPEEET